MNHEQVLKEIMSFYGFKTKKRFQEKIRELLYSTEPGAIIQQEESLLLHDLLKLHPQYKNRNASYFTVSIDSQYKTKHFSFCDRDTLHTIGISYLTCIKGRVMN
jgi:hypothetical protein